MNRTDLLNILPPPRGKEVLIAKRQEVEDIIREVLKAHQAFAKDYDQICEKFASGSVEKKLYDFCRQNLAYDVESEDLQTTRSPAVLLSMGHCDCKGYAGFIAGILDALNRSGKGNYDWWYRFATYNEDEETPGHVFVVIGRPDGLETWVDPVLDSFNKRYPQPLTWIDEKPAATAAAAGVGNLVRMSGTVGGDDAGQQLADALKQYELGLADAVSKLQQNNQLSTGTDEILKQAAASAVPGASQALQIANQVTQIVSQTFGPGSPLTRIITALTSGNILTAPINLIKAIFSGRTFNTDSYLGAWDYFYHVQGVNKGDSTGVADSEVPEALKWWITKLGIYISGRAHLGALREGVDKYMSLYSVNKYTTQDRVRVTYARQVMLQYMPLSPSPFGIAGGWRNTVGVYDNAVTAAIFKNRTMDPNAITDTTGSVPVTLDLTGTIKQFAQSNPIITVGIAAAAAYLLYELFKD